MLTHRGGGRAPTALIRRWRPGSPFTCVPSKWFGESQLAPAESVIGSRSRSTCGDLKNASEANSPFVMNRLWDFSKRLVLCLPGLVPGTWLGWAYAPELLEVLCQPLLESLRRSGLNPAFHLSLPLERTVDHIKIAIFTGLVANVPWTAWQMWHFLAKDMEARRKRRYATGFTACSTLFFCGGVALSFEYLTPFIALGFGYATMGPYGVQFTVSEYITAVTRMLLALGALSTVPVVVTTVYAAGVATWRQLLALGGKWVLVAAMLSALGTPPDVVSQLLLLVPSVLLYFGSAALAYLVVPKAARR